MADPTYTYKHLLETPYNKKWNKKRVDNLDYSMGLFVIFFGTKIIFFMELPFRYFSVD